MVPSYFTETNRLRNLPLHCWNDLFLLHSYFLVIILLETMVFKILAIKHWRLTIPKRHKQIKWVLTLLQLTASRVFPGWGLRLKWGDKAESGGRPWPLNFTGQNIGERCSETKCRRTAKTCWSLCMWEN